MTEYLVIEASRTACNPSQVNSRMITATPTVE